MSIFEFIRLSVLVINRILLLVFCYNVLLVFVVWCIETLGSLW